MRAERPRRGLAAPIRSAKSTGRLALRRSRLMPPLAGAPAVSGGAPRGRLHLQERRHARHIGQSDEPPSLLSRQRAQSARLLRCWQMSTALARPSALHAAHRDCRGVPCSRHGARKRAPPPAAAAPHDFGSSVPEFLLRTGNFCRNSARAPGNLAPPLSPAAAFPGHAGGKTAKALRGAVGQPAAGDFFGPSPGSQHPWAVRRFSRPAAGWPPAAPRSSRLFPAAFGEE
jgi:hypothetical protein